MRRILLCGFLFTALSACSRHDELRRLSVQEVNEKRVQPGVFVFDNNTPERYRRGHVPGAKWLNPGRVTAADLPADKTATLIFYCANSH